MLSRNSIRVVLLAMGLSALPLRGAVHLTSRAENVTLEDGSVVAVEAGELVVPESRRRPTERRVTIPYYRLRSTSAHPASPIFLLAGGPGSSWLDQFRSDENAREVAFYRSVADVVLFDQRGGGHSQPSMTCPQTARVAVDRPLDAAILRSTMRELLAACRDQWLKEGVDLAAYNTVENAADVDELRRALGYRRVTLVGGSYGSHLALQFMRQFPKAVDRVVLYGVEGPDHTWDNPSGMLATLGRIATEAEQSPVLAPHIPAGGLLKSVERVLARLEAAPQSVTVTRGTESMTVLVDANLVRRMIRRGAGRRDAPNAWPDMILAMERGDYSAPARAALDNREARLSNPMHYSMDCASGISAKRRERYRHDPAAALLGDINFEYEALCDLWPSEELGESYRGSVVSDIPTLIFHGTMDMSTPIENAREVVATLRHGQLVEVIGGSHGAIYNLYKRWPPMTRMLGEFLAGKSVAFPRQVVDPREKVFRAPLTSAAPKQQGN
jgi:pimeloyl-ACP methyl ester carboxylesterase